MATEMTNKDRAERVDKALNAYAADDYPGYAQEERETIAQDFLTDLLHWLDANELGFGTLLGRAYSNYIAENRDEED